MKSVHYEVEYKPFDMCGSRFYPDDECGYEERKYRSAAAAMRRADKLKEEMWNCEATRVVKVTREPVSRRRIKNGMRKARGEA